MDIKKTALAGTLESSDIQITLSQGNNGISIDLDSSVEELYGNQIRKVITDTLTAYGIDKGALDCVIKARTMAAAQRALDTANQPDWEVL